MSDHHAAERVSALCPLEDMGVLQFQGADAVRFLQGQLSSDLAELVPGVILRAGLHNPQGRTIALLWLAATDAALLALLPRELTAPVLAQLHRYVLRAKLTIQDQSADWRIAGALLAASGEAGAAPEPGSGMLCARLDARRAMLLLRGNASWPAAPRLDPTQWRALGIAAGEPQVYAATSGQFVAQMLNLDCLGAVSFTKGCYTGQEVIARAHYRGRVKRRMQRFETDAATPLAPGATGRLADGRAFRIVEAVRRADGSSELLAVAPLPGSVRESDAEAGPASGDAMPALQARTLSLPYGLPE